MYPHSTALAARLKRPLVVFDLEHTGGTKENRAVTEIAAEIIHPDGRHSQYSSLVKPPEGTQFLSVVCKLTGIWPETVSKAPSWPQILHEFVLPHREAVWVGFNSRACDTPMVLAECRRYGELLPGFAQLDLIRMGNGSGSLSARVAQLLPNFDTGGAHRAGKDALMTLALLEALLPEISDLDLANQQLIPRAQQARAPRPRNPAPADSCAATAPRSPFLVGAGVVRRGEAWPIEEHQWVRTSFVGGQTVEAVAAAVGRTPLAIACVLAKQQLLSEQQLLQYGLARRAA